MSVGFVSQNSMRKIAPSPAPRSWVRFAKTHAGSQSGFVLSSSADRELASFYRIQTQRRTGFVLSNAASGSELGSFCRIQHPGRRLGFVFPITYSAPDQRIAAPEPAFSGSG